MIAILSVLSVLLYVFIGRIFVNNLERKEVINYGYDKFMVNMFFPVIMPVYWTVKAADFICKSVKMSGNYKI